MSERTEAGRRLLDVIGGMDPQGLYPPDPKELVAAIEAEARADLARRIETALTSEDEIAHGEAILGGWASDPRSREGVGRCAYCNEPWPCRTQQGIDRLLAAVREEAAQ